jgi:hypothetical protein
MKGSQTNQLTANLKQLDMDFGDPPHDLGFLSGKKFRQWVDAICMAYYEDILATQKTEKSYAIPPGYEDHADASLVSIIFRASRVAASSSH